MLLGCFFSFSSFFFLLVFFFFSLLPFMEGDCYKARLVLFSFSFSVFFSWREAARLVRLFLRCLLFVVHGGRLIVHVVL